MLFFDRLGRLISLFLLDLKGILMGEVVVLGREEMMGMVGQVVFFCGGGKRLEIVWRLRLGRRVLCVFLFLGFLVKESGLVVFFVKILMGVIFFLLSSIVVVFDMWFLGKIVLKSCDFLMLILLIIQYVLLCFQIFFLSFLVYYFCLVLMQWMFFSLIC